MSHGENRTELLATILLSVATLLAAWAGYQSTRWHTVQANAQAKATASRIEATRSSGVANREGQVDVALFVQWINAHEAGDEKLASFYRARFTDRFKPAFDAWMATRPFESANAPSSPFALKSYRLGSSDQAEKLEATADVASAKATRALQIADRYVLSVVLLATCLFLAGISTRLQAATAQRMVLAVGWLVFVGTAVWMLTFPVTVVI